MFSIKLNEDPVRNVVLNVTSAFEFLAHNNMSLAKPGEVLRNPVLCGPDALCQLTLRARFKLSNEGVEQRSSSCGHLLNDALIVRCEFIDQFIDNSCSTERVVFDHQF